MTNIDTDTPFDNINTEIEKVLDLDSAHTFNITADVLHRTSDLFLDDNTQIIVSRQVSIWNDDNDLIGSAHLTIEGEAVVADIFLDPATPERFNIETKSVEIYPHVVASTIDNIVWIRALVLSSLRNIDRTIPSL